MSAARGGASTTMACPRCHRGEFLLLPDGRIICADDDCYEPYGTWARPPERLLQGHSPAALKIKPITVCAACRTEACWQGTLMCDEARTAGVAQVTP